MHSTEQAQTILEARSQHPAALRQALEAAIAAGSPTGWEDEDERRDLLQGIARRMQMLLLANTAEAEPSNPQWDVCVDLLVHLSRCRVRAHR